MKNPILLTDKSEILQDPKKRNSNRLILEIFFRILNKNKLLFSVCAIFAATTAWINYNHSIISKELLQGNDNDFNEKKIIPLTDYIIDSIEDGKDEVVADDIIMIFNNFQFECKNDRRKQKLDEAAINETKEKISKFFYNIENNEEDEDISDPKSYFKEDFIKLIIENFPVSNEKIKDVRQKRISFTFHYFFGIYRGKLIFLNFLLFFLTYSIIFKGILSSVHWYLNAYAFSKIENRLRSELISTLIKSPFEKSSEIASTILSQFPDLYDVAENAWSIPNRIIYVIVSISLNVTLGLIIFENRFSYGILLIISLLFSTIFYFIYFLLNKSASLNAEEKRREERIFDIFYSTIRGLEHIKINSSEKIEQERIDKNLDRKFKENKSNILWNSLFFALPEYCLMPNIPTIFSLIFLFFSNSIVKDLESITIPKVVSLYLTVQKLSNESSKIISSIMNLNKSKAFLEVLLGHIAYLNREKIEEGWLDFSSGNIVMDKVTFSYPTRSHINVMKNFSFTFINNKRYGIVGKNGIGKSTFTKLILKNWRNFDGKILIDEKNLNSINTESLHSKICVLTNRPHFLDLSIAENIFYPYPYNEEKDRSKLEEAAKKVKIYDFIFGEGSLVEKHNTILSNNGAKLSEGQKQKIDAMKVFVNPRYEIYILDEILSNVNPNDLKEIHENIFEEIGNRLVIAIDHHPAIFSYVDDVLEFSPQGFSLVTSKIKNQLNKKKDSEKLLDDK